MPQLLPEPDDRTIRRPVVELLDQDGVVLMSMSGTVEVAHTWTRWDYVRWGTPYFCSGVILGVIITTIINLVVG